MQNFSLKNGTTASTQFSEADISNELTISKGKYLLVFVGRRPIPADALIDVKWGASFEHFLLNDINDSFCNIVEVSENSTKIKLTIYNNGQSAKTFTNNATLCRASLVKLH